MSDPLRIRIMVHGPNGEVTEGPKIVPSEEPPRKFDENAWGKDRCIQEFRRFLVLRDDDGLKAAMDALDRLDCWREAFEQLLTGASPNEALGSALRRFWISSGFRIASSLKGNLILVDAFRHLSPLYSGPALRLYRGELYSRHVERIYGISWTPQLSVARMFGDRRQSIEGRGVTLEIDAAPNMIVAYAGEHTSWLGEEEYVVDPRLIRTIRVLD